jgi:hypothetical protein
MLDKRKSFSPKRSLSSAPVQADLARWAAQVRYGGNPEHERNPGDFGLTPPSAPRADKTLCDLAGILQRANALALLREGIRRGLVSEQVRGNYPQNVWAVTEDEIPLEAQLENRANGTYHGYPMSAEDPFREKVIAKWRAANERQNAH